MSHNLSQPERFTITGPQGETYRGGNQEWYRDLWQPGGLRPHHRRHPAGLPLPDPPQPGPHGPGFLQYMEALWPYVTPGSRGWTSRRAWCWAAGPSPCPGGVLQGRSSRSPRRRENRPSPAACRDFLIQSLDANCPVAFLNFSNGSLPNLDSWHWVPSSPSPRGEGVLLCTILDEGAEKVIDLALWQETTLLGGALVTLFPDPAL